VIDLGFQVTGVTVEPYALSPTLVFGLRVTEGTGARVQAITLRTQIRVEPARRRYSAEEQEHLVEMFGDPSRWADTVTPFLWTHVTVPVPRFSGETEVALPVECSYDLEVASGKFLHGLRGGRVPLLLLFSGSVFLHGPAGTQVEQVPWDREARFELPVATWRELMDVYYPGGGYLRLGRETLDALTAFKAARALPTWDAAISALLATAEVST